MRNQASFSVPRQRGEQLRNLARHLRTNVSDLVGSWIDRGLEDAGLTVADVSQSLGLPLLRPEQLYPEQELIGLKKIIDNVVPSFYAMSGSFFFLLVGFDVYLFGMREEAGRQSKLRMNRDPNSN